MNFKLVVPPPRLCTDNGIMIAWNGMEKFNENLDIFTYNNLDKVDIQSKYVLNILITVNNKKKITARHIILTTNNVTNKNVYRSFLFKIFINLLVIHIITDQ